MKSLSRVQLFATPWTVTYQASLSMAFSMQEYWSGLPFPSLGDLPDPGIQLATPALASGFFSTGKKITWETPCISHVSSKRDEKESLLSE